MDIEGITKRLDGIQSEINKDPCEKPDGDRCLETRPDERPGWAWMQPSRMCPGCAAYWYISMAVNELMDLRRAEKLIVAED